MSEIVEQVGSKYRVTLHRVEEYTLEVCAPTKHEAERIADEQRFARDMDPDDYDLIHTDVEELTRLYEDDDEAAEWGLVPSRSDGEECSDTERQPESTPDYCDNHESEGER